MACDPNELLAASSAFAGLTADQHDAVQTELLCRIYEGGGGGISGFTPGSVIFAGATGEGDEDNPNFFWDDTNKRLGIGTATPVSALHVNTGAFSDILLGQWGGGATYNALSLNGVLTATGLTGFFSGSTTDNNLYANVPTGSGYFWRINNVYVAELSSTLLTLPGGITMNGDIVGVGSMDFTPGTAASLVKIDSWGGSVAYGALSFNGVMTTTGMLGLFGSQADTHLYFNVPTGGGLVYRINNVGVGTWDATGLTIGSATPTSPLQVEGLPIYANNAAAVTGGLTVGAFYRDNADPDNVCVVH